MEELRKIVWASEPIQASAEVIKLIGGKAAGLHELKRAGIRVPIWATITTAVFSQLCQNESGLKKLLAVENSDPKEKGRQVYDYLKQIQLEKAIIDSLKEAWQKISDRGKKAIAVRSSAADEDSLGLSFAGQMDSFLNIRSFESFLGAVRSCWASLFGERAVLYRIEHGIDPWKAKIAVVAQIMIEPDVSGVIFTANPITGNRAQMFVSSAWGLGEGLVSGAIDADTFILDTTGNIVKSEIARKKQCVRYLPAGGTGLMDLPEDKQAVPTLSAGSLKNLYRLALQVRDFKGIPMDIEFGIEKGRIYLLQARPITNLKKYEEFHVWDNSNIVESYSGITLPLTFSFIRRAYFAVYWQFCQTIGVDKKTILEHKPIFENMLGSIQGRVYYNLLNWYRLISLMPGFKYNRHFMEQMMGVQVIKDFDIAQAASGKFEKYFVQFPRLVIVGFKMILAHMQLQKRVDRFQKDFGKIYAHYSQLDYLTLTPVELIRKYLALEKDVLWKWKAPITNDFEAMIFYGLLKKLTVCWGLDPLGALQNDLLCAEGGIKSTQVTTQLFYLAADIEKDEHLKEAFLEVPPKDALSRIKARPEFSAIKKKFEEYLQEYGVRCINEMKLEAVPIKDDPVFCVNVIQNYLRNTVFDPARQQEHERAIRRQAESRLNTKLAGQRIFPAISKLSLYRWVLNNTRRAIKNRENQRFCRSQAYSLVRNIMRAIAVQWHTQGFIDQVEDIFYLDIDQVRSFVGGNPKGINLKEQVDIRKKEFQQYKNVIPPDHIEAYGEVDIKDFETQETTVAGDGIIKGLGCCAGRVENNVQVVFAPDENIRLKGEIMVAKQTDPGWVVLFPSISGLIVEKGSMLSHSAIVAREMGIPAVVGAKGATKILSNGDRVLLDGAEGTVKILQKAQ